MKVPEIAAFSHPIGHRSYKNKLISKETRQHIYINIKKRAHTQKRKIKKGSPAIRKVAYERAKREKRKVTHILMPSFVRCKKPKENSNRMKGGKDGSQAKYGQKLNDAKRQRELEKKWKTMGKL